MVPTDLHIGFQDLAVWSRAESTTLISCKTYIAWFVLTNILGFCNHRYHNHNTWLFFVCWYLFPSTILTTGKGRVQPNHLVSFIVSFNLIPKKIQGAMSPRARWRGGFFLFVKWPVLQETRQVLDTIWHYKKLGPTSFSVGAQWLHL